MSLDLKRGTRLGRYELLLRVGRGGMATVWVARERAANPEDERIVAVKAIRGELAEEVEFLKMFLDEGRLVQRIRHPSIVEVFEVGHHGGTMFMAMEWVEGDSLHTLIAEAGKRRPIPAEMAVRIIADVAAGLHAAHETKNDHGELLGVVHRDVSPHNILIGTSGRVKLVDFGVAHARERLAEATLAGQVKGKFGYMSPEQAVARKVDRRSDVFSLGIVLFELTTGRRLFKGESDAETLSLIVRGEIPRPTAIDPSYPPELERIVIKALSRSRRERFQTAREFEKALEKFLKDERIVVPRSGIAALLKRVLGERIEARRHAVRSALEALDGGGQELLSDTENAFAALPDHALPDTGSQSVTGLSSMPPAGTLAAAADHVTGSFEAAEPMRPRSLRVLLLLLVVLGLGAAAAALAFWYSGAPAVHRDSVPAPPAAPELSARRASGAGPRASGPARTGVDELAPIPVDRLGTEESGKDGRR
jgi:serine/threonine-protein kinase